jgi:hypothetical protein
VSFNMTPQQLGAWIARLGSVALVALSAIPADSIPANARPYLAIAGAIILAVDRYVTDPSTGSTPPTPAPAPPPVVTAPAPAPIPATPPPPAPAPPTPVTPLVSPPVTAPPVPSSMGPDLVVPQARTGPPPVMPAIGVDSHPQVLGARTRGVVNAVQVTQTPRDPR